MSPTSPNHVTGLVGGLTQEQWISEWRALGEQRQLRLIAACVLAVGEDSTVIHLLHSLRAPAKVEMVMGLVPWDAPCRMSTIVGGTCCFATSGGKTECVNCGRLG